ncbi:hypothetical protein NC651_014375 [Populus alba x Populus x berolinensis]|nr:hypothetical protein NC651_014375 [Populus alba x Populus x berolinensis]
MGQGEGKVLRFPYHVKDGKKVILQNTNAHNSKRTRIVLYLLSFLSLLVI